MTEQAEDRYTGDNPLFQAMDSVSYDGDGNPIPFDPEKEIGVAEEFSKSFIHQAVMEVLLAVNEEQRPLETKDFAYLLSMGLIVGTRHTQMRLARKLREHGQGLAAAFIEEEYLTE